MDVFAFRKELIAEYEKFSRSFTSIRANDITQAVNEAYDSGQFWPQPLIQLNPNFAPGGWIDDLVDNGTLDAECAKIFQIKSLDGSTSDRLLLHRHQADAIEIAKKSESYVLTTGTGSGKSLAYFIPIIDYVLRRKRNGAVCNGITAIVVYPMNALCNSQCEELHKYLQIGYDKGKEPVKFARYTGQESSEERDAIAKNPPDILLTNYIMLELLMTRFIETDKAIRNHAMGLQFLVLDELHTYRGRQGADVAMLVRRVRERFNEQLICIGTSATIMSEGTPEDRDVDVAQIASQLFGTTVAPENIVSETLQPATQYKSFATDSEFEARLRTEILQGVPRSIAYQELSTHPVAAWVEHELGLEAHAGKFVRITQPLDILKASEKLASASGLDTKRCHDYLIQFLMVAHNTRSDRGQSFFAFRLHQFISGAWNVYSTLEALGERYLTLNGQQFKPGDRNRPLFPLSFCRSCGQEYLPVWAKMAGKQPKEFEPRDLSERSTDDSDILNGYLMPDTSAIFNSNDLENYFPEDWLEYHEDGCRLKPHFRRYSPIDVCVNTNGKVSTSGLPAWFIPGPFRFCLNPECDAYYEGNVRSELTKLSGLSSEGRSSATTILALAALKHLVGTDLDEQTKKLLAFTDNRQDASLQAGHFNDFVQILLLRSALLSAIRAERSGRLTDDVLTQEVLTQLHLEPTDYAANREAKGIKAQNTDKALRDVIGYRLYFDLQRGWRITNPNLEQLKLLEIGYRDLMSCCEDEEEWSQRHSLLGSISPERRFGIVHHLLELMRKALCIKTIYLDPNFHEQLRNRSFNELREPWGLLENERLFSHAFMVPRPSKKKHLANFRLLHISHRSAFGRKLKSRDTWANSHAFSSSKLDEGTYNKIVDDILGVLITYGYVEPTKIDDERTGYRIDSSVLEWRIANDNASKQGATNVFFSTLYQNVASLLDGDDRLFHQLEAREHTAQVESDDRQERERRFRQGLEAGGLPILFCSPTMELGVDISTLNTVYMRNVPPTPANYAQRSGRAGRSGQPALVITYCAARSPHDQYFFAKPTRMVAGAVNPPSIDLANEDLIRSHLQAVWLAETGVKLGPSVSDVLDREKSEELPLLEDISKRIGTTQAVDKGLRRGRRILEMLKPSLTRQAAPWYTDTWLVCAMHSVERRFDDAFVRWRSLFRATTKQMKVADNTIQNAAATEQERRDAKARYDEAFAQRTLLLDSRYTMNSDFYAYRYLAAEGFLPGYNFPRLPLMAFIPGRREKSARYSFLSRPRFLGLTEFGPQSYIYHEGSTYRVRRAILSVREESAVTASEKLAVQVARICPSCGYGHFGSQKEFERCASCDAILDGGRLILNLYRIEQVSTQRANRITSDEEERQRQGYEMVTTVRYSEENGRTRVEGITVEEGGKPLLELRYGPAATLWRINLGWRRRKEKSVYGFTVDSNTGEWARDSQEPTDNKDDTIGEGKTAQRITPYVEDTRNVLVLRPLTDLSTVAIVSLQFAIKRGIEQEFQLEEAELAAEPLPDRDNRKTILFYEAAEGGAGVLTRIATDINALRRIALKALEVCHFRSQSGDWTGQDDLVNTGDQCEAGCYRCLLSYFNQPEHALIDRQDPDMLDLLCRLVRGQQKELDNFHGNGDSFDELWKIASSELEKDWLTYIKKNGYRLPDRGQPYLEEFNTRPDFAYNKEQTLVYIDGPHHQGKRQKHIDNEITRRLQDKGFTVVRFDQTQASWDHVVNEYAWVFCPNTDKTEA